MLQSSGRLSMEISGYKFRSLLSSLSFKCKGFNCKKMICSKECWKCDKKCKNCIKNCPECNFELTKTENLWACFSCGWSKTSYKEGK